MRLFLLLYWHCMMLLLMLYSLYEMVKMCDHYTYQGMKYSKSFLWYQFCLPQSSNILLYFLSILIIVFSILFNTIIALYIMITENMRSYKFHIWTQSCAKSAAVFTVLSAANIEVLTMTNSKLGKSEYFSAPFSERSLKIIFWASTVSFFIGDVMQFIVQVNSTFFNSNLCKSRKFNVIINVF